MERVGGRGGWEAETSELGSSLRVAGYVSEEDEGASGVGELDCGGGAGLARREGPERSTVTAGWKRKLVSEKRSSGSKCGSGEV